MAYQTGTVTSSAGLVSAIKTFAVDQGWSLSGDVLSKGGAYVRLTAPSTSEVRIEGARQGNFAGNDLCARYSRICLTIWPASATYHLAGFDSPDTIWATLNYGVADHVHIGFGSIAKYGDWVGGAWFHAQHTSRSADSGCMTYVDASAVPYNWNGTPASRECALFWSQRDDDVWGSNGAPDGNKVSFLHCELRGYVWEATGSTNDGSDLNIVHCPTIIGPAHKYNPNTFNGQTVLSPFQLFLQNTDGHYMSIGHVGHLRWLKMSNYNPSDILEIGGERWKVFPWHRLDLTRPDGVSNSNIGISTGLLGVAVRYDGE